MKVKDMRSLYVDYLKDMYSAETQLIEALPKVADALSVPAVSKAVRNHLEETKSHKKQVQDILKELKESTEGHECVAMKGLIEEAEGLMESVTNNIVLDAGLIAAAQKVEHYEIASYGTLRSYALLLGEKDQATKLQSILEQESKTNEILNELAEGQVNEQALEENTNTNKRSSKNEVANKLVAERSDTRVNGRKETQKVGAKK